MQIKIKLFYEQFDNTTCKQIWQQIWFVVLDIIQHIVHDSPK